MMTLSIILLVMNYIIQIYDAWATITIIQGGKSEANPVVAWAIRQVGLVPAIIGLKLGISGVLTWAVWGYGQYWPIPVALTVVIVVYVLLFWDHNFKHDSI